MSNSKAVAKRTRRGPLKVVCPQLRGLLDEYRSASHDLTMRGSKPPDEWQYLFERFDLAEHALLSYLLDLGVDPKAIVNWGQK